MLKSKSKSPNSDNEDYVTKAQRKYNNLTDEQKEMLRKYVERQNNYYKGDNDYEEFRSKKELDELDRKFRNEFREERNAIRQAEEDEEHIKNVRAYWNAVKKAEESAERKKRSKSFRRFISGPHSDEVISKLTTFTRKKKGGKRRRHQSKRRR